MRARIRPVACALLLALAGCASAPVTRVVLPQPPGPARELHPEPGLTIRLRQVSLPGYLEDYPDDEKVRDYLTVAPR